MIYYPIFVDLRGRAVLIAGAGPVALRKALGLIEAGAKVTIVAPEAIPEIAGLHAKLVRRRYRASDLRGKFLVIAATNDRKVNAAIAARAKNLGILVNVADAPAECDFLVPARVRHGSLQIALSTGGENPRVAKAMRKSMESLLGQFREKIE